jgi:uncharacterized membrane protein YuzA (DUF378 family)
VKLNNVIIFQKNWNNYIRKELMKVEVTKKIALVLVIVGAINWGLIGFFKYDLVSSLFGGTFSALSRIIFAVVGIAGLIAISFFSRKHTTA